MNKKQLIKNLEKEIEQEKKELELVDSNDYVKQGIIAGRINGLLRAQLMVYDLD